MVIVCRAGRLIGRTAVLPRPASTTSWVRILQNALYPLAPSRERLDEAQPRDAKNLKDAVIATPFPLAVRGRSGPSQADPDTSPFGSGKGGEGNKHRATHDSGRAGLCARAAPYHWAATQGKFCFFVFAGQGRGVRCCSEQELTRAGDGRDHSQQHYLVRLNLWTQAFFLKEAEGQAKIHLHSPLSQFLEVLKFCFYQ